MNFIMVSRNLTFILQSEEMLRKQKQAKPYHESTMKTAPSG